MSQFTVTKIRRHLVLIKNNFFFAFAPPPPYAFLVAFHALVAKYSSKQKCLLLKVYKYNVCSQYTFPVSHGLLNN